MIGHILRPARIQSGRTLTEIARELQLSVPYIRDIELNRRSPNGYRFWDFARVYGVSYDELCYMAGFLPADLVDHDVTTEEIEEAFHQMRLVILGPEYTLEDGR